MAERVAVPPMEISWPPFRPARELGRASPSPSSPRSSLGAFATPCGVSACAVCRWCLLLAQAQRIILSFSLRPSRQANPPHIIAALTDSPTRGLGAPLARGARRLARGLVVDTTEFVVRSRKRSPPSRHAWRDAPAASQSGSRWALCHAVPAAGATAPVQRSERVVCDALTFVRRE